MNEKKNSITETDVEAAIEKEEYGTLGVKTTFCLITLKNGFELVGTSACVDPNNYDIEVGKPYARKKAVEYIWTHLASILQQELSGKKGCSEAVSDSDFEEPATDAPPAPPEAA